jgi:hypothetical protein
VANYQRACKVWQTIKVFDNLPQQLFFVSSFVFCYLFSSSFSLVYDLKNIKFKKVNKNVQIPKIFNLKNIKLLPH